MKDRFKHLASGVTVRRRAFRAEIVDWIDLPKGLQAEHEWASPDEAFVYSEKHGFCMPLESFCQRDPCVELPGQIGAARDTFFSGYGIVISADGESALLRQFCC